MRRLSGEKRRGAHRGLGVAHSCTMYVVKERVCWSEKRTTRRRGTAGLDYVIRVAGLVVDDFMTESPYLIPFALGSYSRPSCQNPYIPGCQFINTYELADIVGP